MADVLITEVTDPGCAWAYSAEPFRQRLQWLYGDSLLWQVRVVGLAESPAEDLELARRPMSAAEVLDHKLANWSGGRRYTCPSYEIQRLADGVRIAVPGFQPFNVYDVVTANLVPGLERRDAAESVEQVLDWASTPSPRRRSRWSVTSH